jgi:hypothetical protein
VIEARNLPCCHEQTNGDEEQAESSEEHTEQTINHDSLQK